MASMFTTNLTDDRLMVDYRTDTVLERSMGTFMGYRSHGSEEVVLSRNKKAERAGNSLVSPVMVQLSDGSMLMQNRWTIRETRRHLNGPLYHRRTLSGD